MTDNNCDNNDKIIDILYTSKLNTKSINKETIKKNDKKRIITTTKKWNFTPQQLNTQYNTIIELFNKINTPSNALINYSPFEKLIIQQINQKLSSYKYQDQLKGIYNQNNIIKSFIYILQLLTQCNFTCFYCNNKIDVIYENVCEPIQWTLERIDNSIGHNYNNVCISFLKCNIGRRTMHQKRYLFTKKCTTTNIELEDKDINTDTDTDIIIPNETIEPNNYKEIYF
jgi:hypothetical protein